MFSAYAKLDKTALSTVKSLGKQCKQLEELNWYKRNIYIYMHVQTKDLNSLYRLILYTFEQLLQKKENYTLRALKLVPLVRETQSSEDPLYFPPMQANLDEEK